MKTNYAGSTGAGLTWARQAARRLARTGREIVYGIDSWSAVSHGVRPSTPPQPGSEDPQRTDR